MKANSTATMVETEPYVTEGSVLDDLGFGADEALELKVKADVYRDLMAYVRAQKYAQQRLGKLLGIHQPDVSDLLNGRVGKFSVARLIKFAGRLNLGAQVRLLVPHSDGRADLSAAAQAGEQIGSPVITG
jgi:predicted XRE-type DNA-binding protein